MVLYPMSDNAFEMASSGGMSSGKDYGSGTCKK